MPTNRNQDLFTHVPEEIIIDIFSRLPIRTIVICKSVCKSWCDLVESPRFAPLHLSRSSSTSHLALIEDLKFSKQSHFGFLDNEVLQSSANGLLLSHYWPKPRIPFIHSSVNGLLFMFDTCFTSQLFVCNPITREYVQFEIHPQKGPIRSWKYAFGFGVSKITGQYKLVKISVFLGFPQTTCEVYTLGTGQWRSVAIGCQLNYVGERTGAAFVNGKLYFLVFDYQRKPRVSSLSCFDLETEHFTSFNCPPCRVNGCRAFSLSALGDRLCLCDDSAVDEIVIWFMKECEDKKSWVRKFIIKKPTSLRNCGFLYPIKAFRDGGLLFVVDRSAQLFYYSAKTETILKKGFIEGCIDYCANVVIYSPNFVSLKTLAMENMGVQSF